MIGLFVTHHFDLQQHEEKVKKGGNISWMLAFVSIHMVCEYTD